MKEKRREKRYTVPEIYQELISVRIKKDPDGFVAAKILNISLSGIKLKEQYPLSVGSIIECSISIPETTIKDDHFFVKVAYCIEDKFDNYYLIGAEIFQTNQQQWLDIYLGVHDFIDTHLRM